MVHPIRAYELYMYFRVAPPLENPFARSLKVDTNSGVAHLKNQVDKVDPNSETVAFRNPRNIIM